MLKRLNTKRLAPVRIETKEDYRAGLLELLNDINQIAVQWNGQLYPLLDSLPGGRTRHLAEERSSSIDPITNGLDGSQVFMDSTATPQTLRGLLYNSGSARPKTIKEVVLDTYSILSSDMARIRSSIDINEAAVAATYDDTNISNWIRRLAADTISDLDQGEEFPTAHFSGNLPTKTLEFSLHQRDNNLRTLIGIDGAGYGTINPGFLNTNFIDGQTIVQAIITLDGEIQNGEGGAGTLQSAYDNGDGTIVGITAKPLVVSSTDTDVPAARFKGAVETLDGGLTYTYGLSSTFQGLIGFFGGEDEPIANGTVGPSGGEFIIAQASQVIPLGVGIEGGMINFKGSFYNFRMSSEAEDNGIRFVNNNSNIGFIRLSEYDYASYSSVDEAQGVTISCSGHHASGISPKGTFDYFTGDPPASQGTRVPDLYTTYKDNTIKASGLVTLRAYDDDPEVAEYKLTGSLVADRHNVLVASTETQTGLFSSYEPLTGRGVIRFLNKVIPTYITDSTPAVNEARYSVVAQIESNVDSEMVFNVIVFAKTQEQFEFRIKQWSASTTSWVTPSVTTLMATPYPINLKLNFQVV